MTKPLLPWFEHETLDVDGWPDRELSEGEKSEIAYAAIDEWIKQSDARAAKGQPPTWAIIVMCMIAIPSFIFAIAMILVLIAFR